MKRSIRKNPSFWLIAILTVVVIFLLAMKDEGKIKTTGRQLYLTNCAACHGANFEGNLPTFPSLNDVKNRLTRKQIHTQIVNGKNAMPPFGHLAPAEINAIIDYLLGEANPTVETTPLSPEKRGELIFKGTCNSCHRATVNDPRPESLPFRHHMEPAPLAGATRRFSKEAFNWILDMGPGYMPSFSNLGKEDREAVWRYLKTLEGKGEPRGMTMMQMHWQMMGRGGMMGKGGMMGRGGMMGMMGRKCRGMGWRERWRREDRVNKPTTEMIAETIREHIQFDQKINDGFYVLEDPRSGKTLRLTLEKIHRDRLLQTIDGLLVMGVDMLLPSGVRYDVDFFVQQQDGELMVFQAMIHKVNDQQRYIWKLKDGYWEQMEEKE